MDFFNFKGGILYYKARDHYNLESLKGAFSKAFADHRFVPNKTPLYLDICQSESGLVNDEIRRLVHYIAKHRVSRIAVMVSNASNFAFARICYRFCYTAGIEAKVFTEPIKAKGFCIGIIDEPETVLRYAS
jgi:hypothetical protein